MTAEPEPGDPDPLIPADPSPLDIAHAALRRVDELGEYIKADPLLAVTHHAGEKERALLRFAEAYALVSIADSLAKLAGRWDPP